MKFPLALTAGAGDWGIGDVGADAGVTGAMTHTLGRSVAVARVVLRIREKVQTKSRFCECRLSGLRSVRDDRTFVRGNRTSSQQCAMASPFESVEDSPFLRAQLRSLDEGVDELRERTARLSKGCSAYRDGLEDAYAN